ncbi:hypothetical protein KVR01_013274 [Diaporthe batatas]|uniref:uncharacterized protein n=1 Tax=Diaporthe batatas TaxID=748121 RepID=UPI001D056109|nr:uncharacterized protein KVR01_013274 [Diaporthe batatas]KAG8156861.1 hypothetical protein KVR01_013274 [Diaporthe batatas]
MALIPYHVVKRRIVWASTMQATCLFVNNFAGVNYFPIYFQAVRGVGPSLSGVYMLPAIVTQILSLVSTRALGNNRRCQRVDINLEPGHVHGRLDRSSNIIWRARNGTTDVQSNIPAAQNPTAIAFMVFIESLVSAIFTVAGNVTSTQTLRRRVSVLGPCVSPEAALAAGGGAKAVRSLLTPGSPELSGLLLGFSESANSVFCLLTAIAIVPFTADWGLGWVDIHKKPAEYRA